MKSNFKASVDMVIVKIIVVVFLVIVMLLPINLIKSLIEEREENQKTVQNEISSKWGGSQTVAGPILVLPFEKVVDKNQNPVIDYAYFLPDTFSVDGNVAAEERSRTIFNTLVYQSNLQISGEFSSPDYAKLNIKREQIKWNDAFILLGIPYLQGIKNKIVFNVNGEPQIVQPGMKNNNVIDSGLTVNMPIDPAIQNYNFDFDLDLNGSESLQFIPVGKENHFHLKSPWRIVSFTGDILPDTRTVDENGFEANWNVLDYNRNYVQSWIGQNDIIKTSSLGVDFKFSVDKYQMTMRSVKYAIMFIALTFVVFFLVELVGRKRIHPVQYLLVSCALILFYTLLLAISEHIGFGLSYLISAFATTALITAYSITIFHKLKQTVMMGVFISGLYTYLYIILQQESMALLLGAIALFIALATVMYVLRKINWYSEAKDNNGEREDMEEPLEYDKETPPTYKHSKDND